MHLQLAAKINSNLASIDVGWTEFRAKLVLSMAWIDYVWPLSASNPARDLVVGAKLSLLEAGTAWCIGSNRGAAASLRTYMENMSAWLYYKDHPIEFRMVMLKDEDLLLPKSIKAYLAKIDRNFDKASSMLFKTAARSNDYYYSDVSHFVHAHPSFVATAVGGTSADVISSPRDPNFLNICSSTDEFLSDLYASHYRNSWNVMPDLVQGNLSSRLGSKLPQFLGL